MLLQFITEQWPSLTLLLSEIFNQGLNTWNPGFVRGLISANLAWQIGSQFLFEDLFCDSWLFFVVDWQSGRGADPQNPNPVPSPESLVTININMGFADIHQCVQNIRSISIKENSNWMGTPFAILNHFSGWHDDRSSPDRRGLITTCY